MILIFGVTWGFRKTQKLMKVYRRMNSGANKLSNPSPPVWLHSYVIGRVNKIRDAWDLPYMNGSGVSWAASSNIVATSHRMLLGA